jgi:hypothetical protein
MLELLNKLVEELQFQDHKLVDWVDWVLDIGEQNFSKQQEQEHLR